MRFTAALTATGLLSYLILEIAKILLAPLVAYLLGVLAIVLKVAAIAGGIGLMIGLAAVGFYVYRRTRRNAEEF